MEFFVRFTSRFPTVEDLAKASFEEALPYFKGLGFYGRLRRMLETAKSICGNPKYQNPKSKKYEFPSDIGELESLPGIGPYTARAVASFAYGQKVLAPDTNVVRILARFFGRSPDSLKRGRIDTSKQLQNEQRKWVMKNLDWFDEQYPKDMNLNQVLMDFGSSVCDAKKPKCSECPLIKKCVYGRDPSQFEYLNKYPSAALGMTKIRKQRSIRGYQKVVVGILIQDQRVLVSRRKPDQTFAGLLEFPGGKVKEGEDLRAAMQREFREEVGVEVSVRPPFKKMALHRQKKVVNFHRCRILRVNNPKLNIQKDFSSGIIMQGMENQDLVWIDQKDLDPKEFLPANKGIIEQLKKSRL